MKVKWLMACSMLFGCDQAQPTADSSKTASPPGQASSSKSTRPFSKEVLPGNLSDFAKPVGEGQTPRTIVHDTPPMDREARGFYSDLGAANEFKAICGFELSEWVEPINGRYYITVNGSIFVSQASLKYKIDPNQRDELGVTSY